MLVMLVLKTIFFYAAISKAIARSDFVMMTLVVGMRNELYFKKLNLTALKFERKQSAIFKQ